MTRLTLAARNTLAQVPSVTALLGSSKNWDTWIFSETPYVRVENKGKCLIVITQTGSWSAPNEYSRQFFPRLTVDVWADPTRNDDFSVRLSDARDKIEAVFAELNKILHTVDLSDSHGRPIIWGTQEEMAAASGVLIMGSSWASGIDFSPISDITDGWMGRCVYNVATA